MAAEAVFVDPKDSTPLPGEVSAKGGVLELQWETEAGEADRVFVLEQSESESFAESMVRYRGTDTGTYLTGLRGGEHYFRIKTEGGDWSPPQKVVMTQISRKKLALLFFTGLLVCAATVGTILLGYFRGRSGAGDEGEPRRDPR